MAHSIINQNGKTIEMIDGELFIDGVNVDTGQPKITITITIKIIWATFGFFVGFVTASLLT